MKIAVHQPEYWPTPRLLAKWAAVDILVLFDHAEFDRASLQHRCRLAQGVEDRWLTIPCRQGNGTSQQVRALEPSDILWPGRHRDKILAWYRAVPAERLRRVGDWFHSNVAPHPDATQSVGIYALRSMTYLADLCEIRVPPIIPSSVLHTPPGGWGQKSTRILNLCQVMKARTYLAGVRGSKYLDYSAFERAGVAVEVQPYAHPPLLAGRSLAERSALHLYLTEGPEAVRVALATRGEGRS
jgi:hypothetical protein